MASTNPGSLERRRSPPPPAIPQHLLLQFWSTIQRGSGPVITNHCNVTPVFDIYANVDRRDLGSVGDEVEQGRCRRKSRSAFPAAPPCSLRWRV